MNKNSYLEYLRTSMITLLFLIILAAGVMLHARFHVGDFVSDDENAIQNDMIGYLISKYKYQEQSNPKNATINLKLGQLYEMLESYTQAETEYLRAIDKRNGNYELAAFRLAGVYLYKKEYQKAENIINDISDTSRYSIFVEKGKFYKSYGDLLFSDGALEDSVEKYDKALFYLKKINNSYVKETEEARCAAYIALADNYVSQGKNNEAIEVLNLVKEHTDNPVVRYKLGLLYLDENPEESVDLFESVLKDNPSIINFSIYKKLLYSLKLQFSYSGNEIKSKLYDAKLIRLRSYIQRNVLSDSEITFSGYKFNVKSFPFRNEYDIIYNFDITNVTNQDIPKLFVVVEFFDKKGNKIYSYTENISPSAGGFKAAAGIVPINLVIKTKKNIIHHYDEILYKLYLTKNPKVSKVLYIKDKLDVTKGKKSK